jgi:hypothetical protein
MTDYNVVFFPSKSLFAAVGKKQKQGVLSMS